MLSENFKKVFENVTKRKKLTISKIDDEKFEIKDGDILNCSNYILYKYI